MRPFQTVFWRNNEGGFVKAETMLSSQFDPDSKSYEIDVARLMDMKIVGSVKEVYPTDEIGPMRHELEYMKSNSRLYER